MRRIQIAAHRGSCGGNIPPNTRAAFKAAINEGADIIETDIARSKDGVFYLFHTGNEQALLGIDKPFEEMTSKELDGIGIRNEFRNPTSHRLDRFEDILEEFRHSCVFNLDRWWNDWDEVIDIIKRHDAKSEILLKSPVKKEYVERAMALPSGFSYMPIAGDSIDGFYALGGKDIPSFMGAEFTFSSEEAPLFRDNTIESFHSAGLLAWGNGIRFSLAKDLSAGHNDDISVTEAPALGWGWLIDKGFDIIQTDWVSLLRKYIGEK